MKNNISLIIAACIPIVLIGIVALVVYIPRLSLDPQYDFVYAVNNQLYKYDSFYYAVTDGKVTRHETPQPETLSREPIPNNFINPQLYIFDTETKTSKQVSLEELETTTVNSNALSPDGFRVEQNRGHNGIFEIFGSRNSYQDNMILQKDGGAGIPITLETDINDTYYYDVQILGWIINQ